MYTWLVCPDLYEVIDSSLDDIRFALSPKYTEEDISVLDKKSTLATDVMGVQYLPGVYLDACVLFKVTLFWILSILLVSR